MNYLARLIMVIGLPASGKTYFSTLLAKQLNATHLNSEKVRQEMGLEGRYDETAKAIVNETLFNKAKNALLKEDSVIVDAVLAQQIQREPFQNLSEDINVPIHWVELDADASTIEKRMQSTSPNPSRLLVYKRLQSKFDPLTNKHLKLSTDLQSLPSMLQKAIQFITG